MEIKIFGIKNYGLCILLYSSKAWIRVLGRKWNYFCYFMLLSVSVPAKKVTNSVTFFKTTCLHCTMVCSYDRIFDLLSFLTTLQTAFHEIRCDFSVFESLQNRFLFPRAKLKGFERAMVILVCHFTDNLHKPVMP